MFITSVLENKKIEFENVDIAVSVDSKNKMRELMSNPTALPPQLFNGDTYLGVRQSS